MRKPVFRPPAIANISGKQSATLSLLELVQVITRYMKKKLLLMYKKAEGGAFKSGACRQNALKSADHVCSRKAKTKANMEDQCERPCTEGES